MGPRAAGRGAVAVPAGLETVQWDAREATVDWLERSQDGYCSKAAYDAHRNARTGRRACALSLEKRSGGFKLHNSELRGGWLTAVEACLDVCRSCRNCRFISVSLKYADCSTFLSCDTSSLRVNVTGFRSAAALPLRPARPAARQPSLWNERGLGIVRHISRRNDSLDSHTLHFSEERLEARLVPIPYPTSTHRATSPVLLLGIISGDASRRELLRCTWAKALAPAARLRFVVGRGQPDENLEDVLFVPVDERQLLAQARKGVRTSSSSKAPHSGARTWTQYKKVVAFLRYAAVQPERLVAKGDDDAYVQPQLLLAYAHLLLRRGSEAVYAGLFEWYSWKTQTLEAVNWARIRATASYGHAWARDHHLDFPASWGEYWGNCSPNGGGLVWDGFDLIEGSAAEAVEANRSCVGPFAFAKGALKFFSTSAISWVVKSERFRRDTERAAQYFERPAASSKLPARTLGHKLSEDAQMGYWLSTHPTLHYVNLPPFTAWIEWQHIGKAFDQVLLVHKMPYSYFAWVFRNSRTSWDNARALLTYFNCSAVPPCDAQACAHQPGQRACHMFIRLPPRESALSVICRKKASANGGCLRECRRGDERIGHAQEASFGQCTYERGKSIGRDIIDHACGRANTTGMSQKYAALLRTKAADVKRCSSLDAGSADSDAPAAVSFTAARGLRIALATLVSANDEDPCETGTHPYGCGLLPWCASATLLRRALLPHFATVEIIGVHAARPSYDSDRTQPARELSGRKSCRFSRDTERLDLRDCPGMRIITPTARMVNASERHAARVVGSGRMSYNPAYIRRGYVFLWKWELWRLGHEFDAVLHSDLDVDLLPSPRLAPEVALEWAAQLPPLVQRASAGTGLHGEGLRMLGYANSWSPWNGALFWAFPPASDDLYREGLDVLEAPWDPSHGWERAGPPSRLFTPSEKTVTRKADGSERQAPRQLRHTSWTRINSGDLDQGFLMYMLQYRHRYGAYMMRINGAHRPAHYVGHKWKPWVRALRHAHGYCTVENLVCQSYLHGAGLHAAVGPNSACAVAFRAAAAELDAKLNRSACCLTVKTPPPGFLAGNCAEKEASAFGCTSLPVF